MSDSFNNSPIGVFDSGVGGLTVAREILRQYSNESIVYFGDTARVPYGSKSQDTIIRYSKQIINFLKTKDVKAIVVACNTASAYALDEVERELDIPIIGVVKPGAKVAARTTKNRRVGIIGTEGTINSGLYTKIIQGIDKDITVYGKACPLFAPLVEEGMLHDSITDAVAARYLEELKKENVDSLILGCTHYPLLRDTIGEIMGDGVNLVNPAYETAVGLGAVMDELGIQASSDHEAVYEFYVSDAAEKFKRFANSILPLDIEMIQQIDIEEYSASL
jgi:glutamate racemase